MRRHLLVGGVTAFIGVCLLLSCMSLAGLPPPNPLWAVFSGYYRYDPRHEAPPPGLVRDLPEESLRYHLDATLKRCNNVYPPGQQRQVARYEVELVEYFGKTDYHASSDIHTRLYFTDGTSVLAVFIFEALFGDNSLFLSFGDASVTRAGAWMPYGLTSDPEHPPPGRTTLGNGPFTCPQTAPLLREWRDRPPQP